MARGQSTRSCAHTLFLPQGIEIDIIFALRAAVSEVWANFKNCHIGHETWPLAKVPEVAHIPSFYPTGSKLTLFFTLRAAVSDIYGSIFKIAIFGHGTFWLKIGRYLGKLAYFCSTGRVFRDTGRYLTRSCTYTLFLPQGVEIELIFTLRAAVSEITSQFSKVPYLGTKLGHWPKFQKLNIYSLSSPRGRN